MLKVLLVSAGLFVSAASFAQDKKVETAPVSAPAQEVIKFNEGVHDFGKIPQGKPVTTWFEITNSGTTPYKIENIHAGCGCTTPEWEKDKTLAPGETTRVKVGYNAASMGNFYKNVNITYNGGQTKEIFIKGEVFATPSESAPASEGVKTMQ